jgi:hypothetical protein
MSFGLLQHGVKSYHILAQGLMALSPVAVEIESNFSPGKGEILNSLVFFLFSLHQRITRG